MMASLAYAYVQTHQNVNIKNLQFFVYSLHHNKALKKILLTDVLETNCGAGGRGGERWVGGKTMRGGLSDDLTCELRPATSARTSCGPSGPPFPWLYDIGVELHHLPCPNRCSSVSLLTAHGVSPIGPHLSSLTHAYLVPVKKRQLQQKSHIQFSNLEPITPFGQTHRSPSKMSSTISPNTSTRHSGRVWKFIRAQGQRPSNLQNTTEKQPTLDLNYCGLSKSMQSNMQGDKAILPSGQIFQITSS